jgi:hypothetical protein
VLVLKISHIAKVKIWTVTENTGVDVMRRAVKIFVVLVGNTVLLKWAAN